MYLTRPPGLSASLSLPYAALALIGTLVFLLVGALALVTMFAVLVATSLLMDYLCANENGSEY